MPADPAGAGVVSPPAGNQLTIRDYIKQQAEKLKIPGDLALAIVDTESGGNHAATSKVGAKGFFQLMPQTAQELGIDPNDPFQNIDGGLRYFKQQLDQHGGDVRLALAAYNAGPAHKSLAAGQVPDIPETRDYVMKVLNTWQAGSAGASAAPRASASVAAVKPALSTPPPAFATAGMQPASPAIASKQVVPPQNALESAIAPVIGFGKQALTSAGDLGRVAERVTGLNLPDLPAGDLAPHGAGEQIGAFAEQAGEYALPAGEIEKVAKAAKVTQRLIKLGMSPAKARIAATAVEGGLQAGPAAAIAEVHGDDPESAAIVSAAMPIASKLITNMAPAIKRVALTRMARVMEGGVSGDLTRKRVMDVAQAAKDFIDLPLQRTWRQTQAMVEGQQTKVGQSLEGALAGSFGDAPVPWKPVVRALDDLSAEAQRLRPIKGGYQYKQLQPDVIEAADTLKNFLVDHFQGYGDFVPARELHDVKKVWWEGIYGHQKAGAQPIMAVKDLLTTAQKKAQEVGSEAIMRVFRETDGAKRIAKLDTAYSHAAKLTKFVTKLATKSRTSTLASPTTRYTVSSAGGALGAAIGGMAGHSIVGMSFGFATARMLMRVVESPQFRLLPIATRRTLAGALAAGRAEQVRKIITPIYLAATADQDNLLSDSNASNSASAAR